MRRVLLLLTAAVLVTACAETSARFKNTAAQDLAWERWRECDNFPGVTLKEVRPDGQIWVLHAGPGYEQWKQCELEAQARQRRAGSPTTVKPADASAKRVSPQIKFGYFIREAPAPGTLIQGDLSNAPPQVQRFDVERDDRVVFFYGLWNQYKRLNAEVYWIDPSGALVDKFANTDDQSRSQSTWRYYTSGLSRDRMRGKPGLWKVEFWMDNQLVGEYAFELLGPAVPVAATAAAAERPTYRIGDRWVHSDGVREVVRIDGDRIELKVGYARTWRMTTSLHVERVMEGERLIVQFDPPIALFQWPLKVGQRWDYRGTVDNRVTGVRGPFENSYEVAGYEQVVTPAGVFEAFKIVSRTATYWYSPRVRMIVRYLLRTESAILRDFELVVFEPTLGASASVVAALPPAGSVIARRLSVTDLRPYYRTSWAVVIGIDQYQSSSIPRLGFAAADARAVAGALPDLGFLPENVILLEDAAATKAAIERAIYGRIRQMGVDDRLFVFFAGHGEVQTIKSGQEGYLLPVDADPTNLPLTTLPMTELAQIGRRLPVKHVLFALDNCFSGYARKRDITPSPLITDLRALTREPVVQILTAGTEGQRAVEQGSHGLFTRHLLKGLEGWADPEGIGLTALKLATFVQERVIRDSGGAQTPQYGKLDGEGEFVFRPPTR